MIDSKSKASRTLDLIIEHEGLSVSAVGRQIAGDPNFVHRLRDKDSSITTKTLDAVWRFILDRELIDDETQRNEKEGNE